MSLTRSVLTQGCWYPRSIPGSQVACPQVSFCVPGLSGRGFPCPLRARRCWDPSGRIRSPSVCSFWLTLLLFFSPSRSQRAPAKERLCGGAARPEGLRQRQPRVGLTVAAVGSEVGAWRGGMQGVPQNAQQGPGRYLCAHPTAGPQEAGTCVCDHTGLGGTPSTGV